MKFIHALLFILSMTTFLKAQHEAGHLEVEATSFKSASGQTIQAQQGQLWVPENRNNQQSDVIAISFVHLKSTNSKPQSPIIYLEGGPGSSCTWQAGNPDYLDYWLPFLSVSDVILLDQRGTGQGSERVLHIWQNEIPSDIFVSQEKANEHFLNIAREAAPALKAKGVDLNGYTSKQSAEDMEDLRKKLGIQQWTLFGFSYGTHLGQAYLRYFEDRVANAILVGVEGPNHTYKLPLSMDQQFRKIALMAQQDPAISKEVPDLEALYKRVIKKLEQNPIELSFTSPLTGQPMPMKIGPFGLRVIMRIDIGDASDIPVFPRLLYAIDQGDYSSLQWFIQKRITLPFGVQGMGTTMDLASGVSPERRAQIAKEEKETLFPGVANVPLDIYDKIPEVWPNPDLGEEFRSAMTTAVPTLFMSGTLDCNTPPFQAEEVRWGFSNGQHIVVRNAGHEQILRHPQAIDKILDFLKGENVDGFNLSFPALKFIPLQGTDSEVWHPALGPKE
ncbi:MAG: alpha/beta hydrolase [Bacteroidota bacterium]